MAKTLNIYPRFSIPTVYLFIYLLIFPFTSPLAQIQIGQDNDDETFGKALKLLTQNIKKDSIDLIKCYQQLKMHIFRQVGMYKKWKTAMYKFPGLNLVKKWFYGAAFDNYFLEVL